MCLITGTNKPELPRIFLVIKKSCATELLDTAANDVKSDWAKTAAILRMELLSHFDGLELHSSGTWLKPVLCIMKTLRISPPFDADHQIACPHKLLPFPRSRK